MTTVSVIVFLRLTIEDVDCTFQAAILASYYHVQRRNDLVAL
jgi:hypothetical protein